VYEVTKNVLSGFLDSNAATTYFVASIFAGAVASFILCPMESVRIRVVTDPDYKGMGLLSSMPKLINEDSFWSLFSGFYAMLSKQIPYTIAKQVSFDIIATFLYSTLSDDSTEANDLKWVVSISAAFMASILSCIGSQPGDMILTETYKSSGEHKFTDVIRKIYMDKNGISGFFVGSGARFLHVSSIITSQLVIYDILKQLLGLPPRQ